MSRTYEYKVFDKQSKKWSEEYHFHLAPNGQLYYGGLNVTCHKEIVFDTGVTDSFANKVYDGSIIKVSDRCNEQVVVMSNEGYYGTDEFALFELVRDEERTFEVVGHALNR